MGVTCVMLPVKAIKVPSKFEEFACAALTDIGSGISLPLDNSRNTKSLIWYVVL